jgi:hypothetical protein
MPEEVDGQVTFLCANQHSRDQPSTLERGDVGLLGMLVAAAAGNA